LTPRQRTLDIAEVGRATLRSSSRQHDLDPRSVPRAPDRGRVLAPDTGERDAVRHAIIEGCIMAGFVQIIEIQTSRIDDVEAIGQQVRRRLDDGSSSSPKRGLFTEDRDRPGYYLNIVEFESYEAAMENSSRPEVSEFASQLAKLCDTPPKFYNLDVRETWVPSTG
jgi:hypothetical protein